MKRDEEETYPMEIRVVVQLPEDKHNEFESLKRKRGLTEHIQTMIDSSEGADVRVDSVPSSYSDERISRLEDGLNGITELLSAVYKNNELDRAERQSHVTMMQDQIRSQNDILQKLTSELGNILNREAPAPVAVEPVAPVVQQMGMSPEMMQQMMATMMAGMNQANAVSTPVTAPVAEVQEEIEKGELIMKKPKKNKRVSAMMDI